MLILHELGELIAFGLIEGEDVSDILLPGKEVLMQAHLLQTAPTLDEALGLITSHWASTAELTSQSQVRLGQLAAHFVMRSSSSGLVRWDDSIDGELCARFIRSLTTEGKTPSVSLQHLRRSALRAAFRTARSLAFWTGDPTIDIDLPARSQCNTRPVTDDEMSLLQMFAMVDAFASTRQPTAIALGQATFRTSEIPLARIVDVDDPLQPTAVETPGTSRTSARVGILTEWGQRVVKSRIRELRVAGAADTTPLVYEGSKSGGPSPQASSCMAIGEVMKRSGLAREADVRPHSLAAWAGKSIYDESQDIEEVARRLGFGSLDRTAGFIQLDWRDDG